MGCDYYIYKKLHIYYNENEYLDIILHTERGYFHEDRIIDSDDESADQNFSEYIRFTLIPKMKPNMIYDGKKWNNPETETKYKNIIEKTIKEHNISMTSIIKIVKVEERRQR